MTPNNICIYKKAFRDSCHFSSSSHSVTDILVLHLHHTDWSIEFNTTVSYVCACVCVHVHKHVFNLLKWMYMYVCLCIYIWECTVCICLCGYICICAFIYICMYINFIQQFAFSKSFYFEWYLCWCIFITYPVHSFSLKSSIPSFTPLTNICFLPTVWQTPRKQ